MLVKAKVKARIKVKQGQRVIQKMYLKVVAVGVIVNLLIPKSVVEVILNRKEARGEAVSLQERVKVEETDPEPKVEAGGERGNEEDLRRDHIAAEVMIQDPIPLQRAPQQKKIDMASI